MYKVLIKNITNNGLYINDDMFKPDNNYIKYQFNYNDGNNYIKPGEEKKITIKISYDTEADKNLFMDGKYSVTTDEPLVLSDILLKIPDTLKNISILLVILFIVILIAIIIGIRLICKNKSNKVLLLLLLILIIPKGVSALLKVEIPINSKVLIELAKEKHCTYEGELTPGAEYNNGQYKYFYKRELNNNSLQSIDIDGWGVFLTNKDSTDPVTTELCTYINDKPVVSMSSMFSNAKTTSIDFSSFNTSNIVNMKEMFKKIDNQIELDFSTFDFSNVEDMSYFIAYAPRVSKINLTNKNLSKVTSLKEAFYGAGRDNTESFDIVLENINAPLLTDFDHGLSYMGQGTKKANILIKNVIMPNVTTGNQLFVSSAQGAKDVDLTIDNFDIRSVNKVEEFFYGVADGSSGEVNININNLNVTNATSAENMFRYVGEQAQKVNFKLSNLLAPNAESAYGLFYYSFTRSKDVEVTLKNIDLSGATNATSLFYTSCNRSDTCKISFDNFDISNATNLNYVFNWAGEKGRLFKIEGLDSLNTKKASSMNSFFYSSTEDNAEGYKELGTLNVYADNIGSLFSNSQNAKAVVNIYEKPSYFDYAFYKAATTLGSEIIVNYTSKVDNIDEIIATKSDNSNVIKGSLIED